MLIVLQNYKNDHGLACPEIIIDHKASPKSCIGFVVADTKDVYKHRSGYIETLFTHVTHSKCSN